MRSLSPTRAGAFRACPQAFKFRYVDGLPEPEDRWMARGTLVHAVCEHMLGLEPALRTPAVGIDLLHRLAERLVDDRPQLRSLFADAADASAWLASAELLVRDWCALEDVAALDAAGRELALLVEDDGLLLAGILDRLDRERDGTWTVTDYKTGTAPPPGWEHTAFAQLRFYAMLLWQDRGLTVSRLRLVYLGGGGEILQLAVDQSTVVATRRSVHAVAAAIDQAEATGDWRANVSRACDWCAFRSICPAHATTT